MTNVTKAALQIAVASSPNAVEQPGRRGRGRPKIDRTVEQKVLIGAPISSDCTLADRLLPKRDVMRLLGICNSSVYRWIKSGHFPRPVQLGPRRVAWRATDISAFIASRQTAAA